MKKIYYKVVSATASGKCLSSYANGSNSQVYKVGTTVVAPKDRPLFIFDSLENATKYRCFSQCIYTCHATHVRKVPELIPSHNYAFDDYWDKVTSLRKKHKPYYNLTKVPTINTGDGWYYLWPPLNGTLWCNSVTLIEQVS